MGDNLVKISRIPSYIVGFARDMIDDRKLRKIKRRFSKCGENLLVYGKPYISFPENIEVGNNVNINHNCEINATGSYIKIGNNVTISSGAKILSASYEPKEFLLSRTRRHIYRPTIIGDNVWICAGAIINPGVTICGDVIIASGAVVCSDIVQTRVIVAGNPAQIVKRYEEE